MLRWKSIARDLEKMREHREQVMYLFIYFSEDVTVVSDPFLFQQA